MSSAVPEPNVCTFCGYGPFTLDHWIWTADERYKYGGHWRCRQRKRARGRGYGTSHREDRLAYFKQYNENRKVKARYFAYRNWDKRRYDGNTIPWDQAEVLMGSPCNYCELSVSEGLDRRDNARGHSADNVVPCCTTCNMILGDLPEEVKDLLAEGLRHARIKGLLDTWVSPQLRKAV